ncbi:hypothetical protein wCauATS_03980 [Wolbachia pipientis]
MNQSQREQVEVWIEENPNITIKEMKIRIQEKFGLNISKSTVHRNMQRMKFSYITPRPVHNGQDKSKQEEFKKILMKLLSCILKKSYFSSMNRGLAHIQRLDTGGLKKALGHRLR